MKLSAFGEKFTSKTGIIELMDDLGSALNEKPDMIFMGGGNPAHLDAVEQVFQERLSHIMNTPDFRHRLLGIYQSPQGDKTFREHVARFLQQQFGWQVTANNIAVANGSQSAFFVLYNMFAGAMSDGSCRSIHLPLSPEYLGYGDVGLSKHFFTATKPSIELLDNNLFKYHVNFADLSLSDNTGALCVSRPTNPTGNVLTDAEIAQLDQMATSRNIPLIIDGAYGLPFPSIVFNDAAAHWNTNTILALSLSKLGLPGVRTGIIVAREDIIEAYTHANTIINLACGNLGPAIAKELFNSGEIITLTRDHITPFYRQRSQLTVSWFRQALQGIPFHIHKPEGAIFLWLWFEGLPISSKELYQRLKQRGVLVVPGHDFFIGIDDDWVHKHECIRVSYAQDEATVQQGINIIAEEVKKVYITDTP